MGAIRDEHGLEQGGSNSSDEYKSYNNKLLTTIQNSKQGVDLGNNLVVSGVGQADDVALLANCICMLLNILILSMEYCLLLVTLTSSLFPTTRYHFMERRFTSQMKQSM